MALTLVCLALLGAPPAAEAALPKPRTISLQADKVKLRVVLADLAKQLGVAITDRRDADPDETISLRLTDATYWQALTALAEAAHARLGIQPREGRITLLPAQQPPNPPTFQEGFFRATVQRVSAVRDFETGSATYTAAVEIAWQPSLQPLYLETQPRNYKVKDINGQDLPTRQEGSSLGPVDGRAAVVLDLPLPSCDRSVKSIGQVQGTLSAIAPSRMLTLSFAPLDQLEKQFKEGKPALLKQDGVTCTISRVVLASDRWSVRVELDYPPGGPKFESYQSWVVNNEMTLTSKDGTKHLASSGFLLERTSSRQAVLTYHFTDKKRGRPEDWKLEYRTPASLVEIPFTFTLKDIALP